MKQDGVWDNKDIIRGVLGRAPDVEMNSFGGGWSLCRWRQFVGRYSLPALPQPVFAVHVAGKPQVKTGDRDGWTEASSIPGCATIIPAGMPTDWLVDGELDAVTLSMPPDVLAGLPHADRFDKMRFAFADPLAVALTRQILSELYAPQTEERTAYIAAMANALKAHILSGPPAHGNPVELPVSDFSAYRLHQIMNAVLADPAQEHSLEQMALVAGVTPSHFCRLFKKAMGISPHQYVMQARLDRAQQMLVQTNLNLATLSEMAGFTSQSHFSRAFRARFGMAPSDYRQQERRGAH